MLYNIIFNSLPDEDKIAFFVSVYRWLSNYKHANLDTSLLKDIFYKFAPDNLTNHKLITSINRYEGKDLRFFCTVSTTTKDNYHIETHGGSINTIAYKTSTDFICTTFNLSNRTKKTLIPTTQEVLLISSNHTHTSSILNQNMVF